MSFASKKRTYSVESKCSELFAKKVCAQSQSKPTPLNFLLLADDCLLAIFDFLPLSDLCTMRRVCKRLNCLSGQHFQRKYSSKWMHFEKGYASKWDLEVSFYAKPAINYIKHFGNCIRSVDFVGGESFIIENGKCIKDHEFDYVKVPRGYIEHRESIIGKDGRRFIDYNRVLNGGYARSDYMEYKQVQFKFFTLWSGKQDKQNDRSPAIVKKAETIGFWDCVFLENFTEKVPLSEAHCLKNLAYFANATDYKPKDHMELFLESEMQKHQNTTSWKLCKESMHKYQTEWMSSMEFPQLTHFQFQCYSEAVWEFACERLPQFLQRHSTLTSLTWHFCYFKRETLASIIKHGTTLEELLLSFWDDTYDLAEICDELKPLCERRYFKRLELSFSYNPFRPNFEGDMIEQLRENTGKLASLNKLTGLHIPYLPVKYEYGISICLPAFINLKVLRGSIHHEEDMSELAQGLQNLEEYFVEHSIESGGLKYRNNITPFIRYCPKLKTIVLNDTAEDWNEIRNFNGYRKELENAGKFKVTNLEIIFLTKLFTESEIKELKMYFHQHNQRHSGCAERFVELKVLTEIANVLNVKHPLIRRSLEET